MKTHSISVTVEKDSIQVTPDPLVMNSLEEVQWTGKTARKFSIVFEGAGPFASSRLAHSAASTRQRPGAKGRFKYSVVSDEDPSVMLDPIIIVEEPPTHDEA